MTEENWHTFRGELIDWEIEKIACQKVDGLEVKGVVCSREVGRVAGREEAGKVEMSMVGST